MRVEELPEVRNLPLFSSIKSPVIRDELLRVSNLKVFDEQKQLFPAETEPKYLHILLDGYAKLHMNKPHRHQIIEVLGPGSMFIMAAVLLSVPQFTAATLLTSSRVVLIPAKSLQNMIQLDIGLAMFLLNELGESLRQFVIALSDRKSLSAKERFEKHYAGKFGPLTGSILKKKDASSLIDVAPQTFAKLANAHAIDKKISK